MYRAALLLSSFLACLPDRQASHSSASGKRLCTGLLFLLFSACCFAQPEDQLVLADTVFKTDVAGGKFPANFTTQVRHNAETAGFTLTGRTDTSGNVLNYKKRKWLIGGINAAGYGGSLVLLSQAWYKDYPKSKLHSFNDSREWLQVDKLGHAWTAYNTGRASAAMWKWAGLKPKTATLVGGFSGAAYLTVIEILDGYSAEWGWSWADIGANVFGSGLFMSQELAWKEQRIQYKFSFHTMKYGEPQLNQRADNLFGKSWYERMLKDYNGQTYWLSANLKSFFPESKLPAWLNVAVGYGAEGMLGGFENKWTEGTPPVAVNRADVQRRRQFYLAPDIDLTKIKTKKKWLRVVFSTFNSFKFPAPALSINSAGKLRFSPFYF